MRVCRVHTYLKVPFSLAPRSSVQCVFELISNFILLPEFLPALREVFCRECRVAGFGVELLRGERGDPVCSPEPQWTRVRDSRVGVW